MKNTSLYKKIFKSKASRFDRIGIAVLDERPEGVSPIGRRTTHCNLVAKARQGNVLYAEPRNYSCNFAVYTLGLEKDDPALRNAVAKELGAIKNALTVEVKGTLLSSTPRLPEGEKFIACFPLDMMPFEPDVVLFIGNPVEIMDLVWEIASRTGERLETNVGAIGAMCTELTVQTILSGKSSLSVGCCGSRKFGRLEDNEIMLSMPWAQYRHLFGEDGECKPGKTVR